MTLAPVGQQGSTQKPMSELEAHPPDNPAGEAGASVCVAIPVLDEEDTLSELIGRVRSALATIPGGPHEIVIVNDGSSDATETILDEAVARDPALTAVHLSRNFGHQAAITAALDFVRADYVVVMEGDLQDPPEAIPKLVAKAAEGFDVVFVRRTKRKEGRLLRLCYYLSYRLIALMSEVPLPTDAGDFGLMSRRVVEELRRAPERHRYLRGLRAWVGFRQVGLEVERASRAAGESKYSYWRLLQLAVDGLFAFSVVPLRAMSFVGIAAMAASGFYGLYAIYQRLVSDIAPRGFTALLVVMIFLFGVQLFFMGTIGSYVGRIYEEVKARPRYVVRRVVGDNRRNGRSP